MRTVVLLGFIVVADAIREDWVKGGSTSEFLAVVLLIAAFMDIFDFFKNISRKN
jgi:hypothetical protein